MSMQSLNTKPLKISILGKGKWIGDDSIINYGYYY